jgi:hypothetical protein
VKSYLRTVAVLLAATVVRMASAQDLAPIIDHQPTTQALHDQPVELRAKINSVSGKGIYQPTVYVRVVGITGYSRIQMQPVAGTKDVFFATIPASLTASDFDYYVEAFDEDGNGPGRSGTPETPLHVAVGAAAPVAPPGTGLLEGEKLKFAGQEDPRQMNNGRGKIVAGAVLSGIGIVCLVIALASSIVAASDYTSGDATDGDLFTALEYVAVLAGIALTATGIALIVVGVVTHKRWSDAMQKAGLQVGYRVEPHTHAGVMTMAMRF